MKTFTEIPFGTVFKFKEGRRVLTAVKIADTDICSPLGVRMYTGNAILLMEDGGLAREVGLTMMISQDQEVE